MNFTTPPKKIFSSVLPTPILSYNLDQGFPNSFFKLPTLENQKMQLSS